MMFSWKFFKNFLNSSSRGYLVESVAQRYSRKNMCSCPIACNFIEKEAPTLGLLFSEYRLTKYLRVATYDLASTEAAFP